MKKTYINPEILIAQVKVETILNSVSGLGLSGNSASQSAGMEGRSRGSRSDNNDSFEDLW